MHPILADPRRLRLHLGAWGLVGGMLALLVRGMFNAPWLSAFVFALPLGLAAAPISLSAWYLCRALPLSRTPLMRVATASGGAALVTAGLWAALGLTWARGMTAWGVPAIGSGGRALLTLLVGYGALAYLAALANTYLAISVEESTEASKQALKSLVAQREAELTALRAKIDPHFLFNSLNSISGLAVSDPAGARDMCLRLSQFLRESLALGGASTISLGREIALAQQYLSIEQVRFGARLTVEAQVTDDSADVAVPPLLLQPLVENAVRHGIATCLEGGRIEISARCAGERAVITVTNPRDADGGRRGTGLGLGIVRRQLSAAFGDAAALVLEPAADSYRATVTLPITFMPVTR